MTENDIADNNGVFIIEKFWYDPMENRNAYGWEQIGYVVGINEAKRISNLKFINPDKSPWPLEYAKECYNDKGLIPVYRYKSLVNLEGFRG